jgi:cell shape-determining protein MreD
MNAVFFIILTLFLIVIQTVILPSFSWFAQCFDLLIIEILFLSFVSSHYSMVFAIITIGCVMDSISGVPFCYYIFSYLWIYIIVQMVKQLLFQRSTFFVFIISIVSILIQHGLSLFSAFVNQGDNTIWDFNLDILIRQVFWGIVFIPPGIWLLNACWQNWILKTKIFQNNVFENTEDRVDRIQ